MICNSVDNVIPFVSPLASGGWHLPDDLRGSQHLADPNSQPCTLKVKMRSARPAVSTKMVFVTKSCLLRSFGFWLPTLPTEGRAHGKLVRATVVSHSAWPSSCQSATRVFTSSSVSEDCASTLEKHESLSTGDHKRVASIASPALTLKPRNLHFGRPLCLVCTSC